MKKIIEELKLDTIETEESKIFFKMVEDFLNLEKENIDIDSIKIGFDNIDLNVYLNKLKNNEDTEETIFLLGTIDLCVNQTIKRYNINLRKMFENFRTISISEDKEVVIAINRGIHRVYWYNLDGTRR